MAFWTLAASSSGPGRYRALGPTRRGPPGPHGDEKRFLERLSHVAFLQVHGVGGDPVTAYHSGLHRALGQGRLDPAAGKDAVELVDHGGYAVGVDRADRAHEPGGGGVHRGELRYAFAAEVRLAGVRRVIDPVPRLTEIFEEAHHLQPEQRKNPKRRGLIGEGPVHTEVVVVAGAEDPNALCRRQFAGLDDGLEGRKIGRQVNVGVDLSPPGPGLARRPRPPRSQCPQWAKWTAHKWTAHKWPAHQTGTAIGGPWCMPIAHIRQQLFVIVAPGPSPFATLPLLRA